MHKEKFLESCLVKADMNDVKIISGEEEAGKMNPKLTFDSRPPRAPAGMLCYSISLEPKVEVR